MNSAKWSPMMTDVFFAMPASAHLSMHWYQNLVSAATQVIGPSPPAANMVVP
jgi:hypothetical protein